MSPSENALWDLLEESEKTSRPGRLGAFLPTRRYSDLSSEFPVSVVPMEFKFWTQLIWTLSGGLLATSMTAMPKVLMATRRSILSQAYVKANTRWLEATPSILVE